MAAGTPPGMGIGMEDGDRLRFNQLSDNLIHDDGAWTENHNLVGQRINLLIIMISRLFAFATTHETFSMETVQHIQHLQSEVQEIASRTTNVSHEHTSAEHRKFQQSMLDSKTFSFMKPFAGEHSQYKIWIDKFVNAAAQIRPGSRAQLETIIKSVARGESLESISPLDPALSEDIYAVLFDKTEGEPHNIIGTCTPGDGQSALFKLHQHFSEISGQALSMRVQTLMNPNRAKHEWEVNGLIDKWLKNIHHLEGIAPTDGVLPVMFKVNAISRILCGKLSDLHDNVSNNKIRSDTDFRAYLGRIKEDARKKELEHNAQTSQVPMDTDMFSQQQQQEPYLSPYFSQYPSQGNDSWPSDSHDYASQSTNVAPDLSIDAFNKGYKGAFKGFPGKGKGNFSTQKGFFSSQKGFFGKGNGKSAPMFTQPFRFNCKGCGLIGHSMSNCPKMGKGYGGTCTSCGILGHPASLCPTIPYAGPQRSTIFSGKDGKGKGKSINLTEQGDQNTFEQQQQQQQQQQSLSQPQAPNSMYNQHWDPNMHTQYVEQQSSIPQGAPTYSLDSTWLCSVEQNSIDKTPLALHQPQNFPGKPKSHMGPQGAHNSHGSSLYVHASHSPSDKFDFEHELQMCRDKIKQDRARAATIAPRACDVSHNSSAKDTKPFKPGRWGRSMFPAFSDSDIVIYELTFADRISNLNSTIQDLSAVTSEPFPMHYVGGIADINSISHDDSGQAWEELEITIDSGAAVTVMPPEMCDYIPQISHRKHAPIPSSKWRTHSKSGNESGQRLG